MAISKHILDQAADWLVLLHSGEMTEQQQHDFLIWKNAHPDHQIAMDRMQKMLGSFADLPAPLNPKRLIHARQHFQQQVKYKLLWILSPILMVSIAAYQAPWQRWQADVHSAKGNIQSLTLEDGTQLVLASDSYVNIDYSSQHRNIKLLQGEVFIQTAKETSHAYRPIMVTTDNGTVQALGTQFSVRQDTPHDLTAVNVYQHAVAIHPKRHTVEPLILPQGQSLQFSQQNIVAQAALKENQPYWTQHLLVADNLPLDQVLAEIYRYHRGVYFLDPRLKQIKVSGVFSLQNTQQSLQTLAQTYHFQLDFYSDYLLRIRSK